MLLPLRDGALLVSPGLATFCRIPVEQVALVQARLTQPDALRAGPWPPPLLDALTAHGFFGPPRPVPADPPLVQLQLTNSCNLACDYCCTDSGAARAHELEPAHWFRLVDEVRAWFGPQTRMALLGGEVLQLPWALELAGRILDRRLSLTLFTNGTLLGAPDLARRVARLIARGGEVRVSLAGVTSATSDGSSGRARHAQTLAGLQELARHGQRAAVDLMLRPEVVAEVAAGLPRLRDQLPPGTRLSLGLLYHGGRERGAQVFTSRIELEAALDRIAFAAGERIPAPVPRPLASRREGCACTLGHQLHVRSDGTLYRCFRMEEPLAELGEAPLAGLLARVPLAVRPAREQPRCAPCPLATLCGGGCRTENLLFTGDPEQPPCGPWRVQVCAELLAEDRPDALEWPVVQLFAEAQRRGLAGEDVLPNHL